MGKILQDVSKAPATVTTGHRKLTAKVTEKGGVSVYGLQRFPVTLYREQWETLLAHADKIRAFMEANASQLRERDEPVTKDGRTAL